MSELFEDYPEHDRIMLNSAFNTITIMEAWTILKDYEVSPNKGFLFNDDPQILKIINKVSDNYVEHSGFSMAFTMRKMYEIAKLHRL